MTLQNLKDYNETQYGESRIELLHKFQPFVDALKNQKPGKQSSMFICPIYLLEASPTNRKIYKDFELYLKDPNADTKLVRKMNYLIHGESGLLNYSYSDPDGVGNQEPICIDENGYIKVTEDSGYQYYHVVSVENGVIATLEGDEQGVVDDGVSVADQWLFTTRAAAEEYYYSKVNPKDWMWFDQYPWVYSNELQEWLYFYPSGSKLLYWSNQAQTWREFSQ